MKNRAIIMGLGLLFYILLGFRYYSPRQPWSVSAELIIVEGTRKPAMTRTMTGLLLRNLNRV